MKTVIFLAEAVPVSSSGCYGAQHGNHGYSCGSELEQSNNTRCTVQFRVGVFMFHFIAQPSSVEELLYSRKVQLKFKINWMPICQNELTKPSIILQHIHLKQHAIRTWLLTLACGYPCDSWRCPGGIIGNWSRNRTLKHGKKSKHMDWLWQMAQNILNFFLWKT